MTLRKLAVLVVSLCLLVVAGCGGGKSSAAKVRDAAAQAKAACDVFVDFHPPAGTDAQSQIDYAKATYGAFLEAAHLARNAALEDPRWRELQTATRLEAEAFQVIVKDTVGASQIDQPALQRAVAQTKSARVVFIAQCVKADPVHFKPSSATPTPSASPTSS